MSNYVMNTLSATRIGKLPIYSRVDGKRTFDFGKLVPVPESLKQLPEKPTSLQLKYWDRWLRIYWGATENAVNCHIGMDEISFFNYRGFADTCYQSFGSQVSRERFCSFIFA